MLNSFYSKPLRISVFETVAPKDEIDEEVPASGKKKDKGDVKDGSDEPPCVERGYVDVSLEQLVFGESDWKQW